MSLSPRHITLVEKLDALVRAVLSKEAHSRQERPLNLADSMPEPDLAVVPGQVGDYGDVHPTSALWVVEVAAVSVASDRRKAPLYAEAGIPEYWVVLVEKEAVEVYTDPHNGRYTRQHRYSRAETITSVALPPPRAWTSARFSRPGSSSGTVAYGLPGVGAGSLPGTTAASTSVPSR